MSSRHTLKISVFVVGYVSMITPVHHNISQSVYGFTGQRFCAFMKKCCKGRMQVHAKRVALEAKAPFRN